MTALLKNCGLADCHRGIERGGQPDAEGTMHPAVRVICKACNIAGTWQVDDSLSRAVDAWNGAGIAAAEKSRAEIERARKADERQAVQDQATTLAEAAKKAAAESEKAAAEHAKAIAAGDTKLAAHHAGAAAVAAADAQLALRSLTELKTRLDAQG